MLGQYRDGRGYTRNYVLPRSSRPVTITEDETIELHVPALRDVEHDGLVVQIITEGNVYADTNHSLHRSGSLDTNRAHA